MPDKLMVLSRRWIALNPEEAIKSMVKFANSMPESRLQVVNLTDGHITVRAEKAAR